MQDVEVGLGPCEGDVEQSPLLLDLGVRFGGQVGWDVSIGRVQDEDRLPLQALGHKALQTQCLLNEMSHTSLRHQAATK